MLQRYRQLIDDPVRLGAFQRAIATLVRPGDVVADIGCGLGTYAIFAARAGARRVFAVDDSPIVEVAREVVRDSGADDVVELIAGYSTALEPPERCDVVIFEDYLTTLVSPGKARVVADLESRWLEPGGRLLPARARLWLAPVEDPEGHLHIDRFHWSKDRVFGIDFGSTRRRVFSSAHPRKLGAGALLATPELAHDYDLLHLKRVEVSATRTLPASRDGVIHGLLLWFELELGGAWLGTGPLAPPSAWQQTLFPLATPLQVAAGAPIDLALQAAPLGEILVWRWSVAVGGRRVDAHSLDGSPMLAEALALSRPEHVPAADVELEIDRTILDAVDGRRSIAALAALLRARFAARFADDEAAAARVARILSRYA
ncbi:MAG TPA: class I SAM-dependent methyltransferase [Polyangia bacterium]